MNTKTSFNFKFILGVSMVSAMGGFLFGYDWVVIGGAKFFYEAYFGIDNMPLEKSKLFEALAMSSALIGCIPGAILSGYISDRFGRKKSLITAGLLFSISALGSGMSNILSTFLFYRIVGGIGIGIASSISPIYIAELAPKKIRGFFVTINQLTIVLGILAAQIVNFLIADEVPTADQIRSVVNHQIRIESTSSENNIKNKHAGATIILDKEALAAVKEEVESLDFYNPEKDMEAKSLVELDKIIMSIYIKNSWNGKVAWRWMFWAELIPALLFFILAFFIPESPRWLIKKKKDERSFKILSVIGGTDYAAMVVNEIKESLKIKPGVTNLNSLLGKRVRPILIIGVVLAAFQQWCGINIVFNYAKEVFTHAGFGINASLFNIVITGIVNLLFTLVALKTVDGLGRRKLMLLGSIGLAITYIALGYSYYFELQGIIVLILILLAIAIYAMSLAPITWVVLSEIFPNRIRGAAMAIATTSLWIASAILVILFPYIREAFNLSGAFWIYAGVCALGFLFIRLKLPETKGKSLEEIEKDIIK